MSEKMEMERAAFEDWSAKEWTNSNPPQAAWIGWQARALMGVAGAEKDQWYDAWNPMEFAPKDRVIFACNNATGHSGKVIYNAQLEWECVDFRDQPMGIGFYPTHWHLIGIIPL